jgi:SAM-dependent methyltransferase
MTSSHSTSNWHEAQRQTWARRAALYNRLDWATKSDFLKVFLDYCPVSPQTEALDIGIGTGVVAEAIAPHVKKVTGIDISPEMIAQIKAKAALSHIECHEADVQEMPFDDNCFHLCTARMVFHHVENCMRGLREVFRVLRPRGHIVLIEGVPPDHLTRKRYEEIFALKEQRHTFSEAELINMFYRAGFKKIALFPHFMEQVSLNNWLGNSALAPDVVAEIRRLHVEADDHFKQVYNLNERNGDVFMDWKFAILVGEKG